jgi:hypothetical protein
MDKGEIGLLRVTFIPFFKKWLFDNGIFKQILMIYYKYELKVFKVDLMHFFTSYYFIS